MMLTKRRMIAVMSAWVGFLGGRSARGDTEKLILQREWTANAEFAGDVWAAQVAAQRGIVLEVHEGSELIDPIKMVRSAQAHFGVASADRILRENEGGAELVIVGTATYKSPVVFLTKPKLNIQSPQDFVGRTIGIQPGTNTDLVFQALVREQNLPLNKLKVVDSGWGTQMFETGVVDVLGAFAYDEPITLRLKGYTLGKIIVPDDYGVHYVGTVYFTRKRLIDDHEDLVQTFVSLLVRGWTDALANPGAAMDLLAKRFESVRSNLAKERLSFEAGRPYFGGEGGHVLYASKARWLEMGQSLRNLGKLRAFDFNANVDYRFLEKAAGR